SRGTSSAVDNPSRSRGGAGRGAADAATTSSPSVRNTTFTSRDHGKVASGAGQGSAAASEASTTRSSSSLQEDAVAPATKTRKPPPPPTVVAPRKGARGRKKIAKR